MYLHYTKSGMDAAGQMTDLTEHATLPKSTKSNNWYYSVQIQIQVGVLSERNPNAMGLW